MQEKDSDSAEAKKIRYQNLVLPNPGHTLSKKLTAPHLKAREHLRLTEATPIRRFPNTFATPTTTWKDSGRAPTELRVTP